MTDAWSLSWFKSDRQLARCRMCTTKRCSMESHVSEHRRFELLPSSSQLSAWSQPTDTSSPLLRLISVSFSLFPRLILMAGLGPLRVHRVQHINRFIIYWRVICCSCFYLLLCFPLHFRRTNNCSCGSKYIFFLLLFVRKYYKTGNCRYCDQQLVINSREHRANHPWTLVLLLFKFWMNGQCWIQSWTCAVLKQYLTLRTTKAWRNVRLHASLYI